MNTPANKSYPPGSAQKAFGVWFSKHHFCDGKEKRKQATAPARSASRAVSQNKMRKLIPLFVFLNFSCTNNDVVYERTSISLPSDEALYIKSNSIDSLSDELMPSETLLPKSITQNINKNIESRLKEPIDKLSYLDKKVYEVSADMNLFVVTAISEDAKTGLNFIGAYKNGNFDYFTSIYKDSTNMNIESKLIKFEEIGKEFLITSKNKVNKDVRYGKMSFKDTIDQLLWYKFEM